MIEIFNEAVETAKSEGYKTMFEVVDGELQEILPLTTVFRALDLIGTPESDLVKKRILERFAN